jgi:hypothetical protein
MPQEAKRKKPRKEKKGKERKTNRKKIMNRINRHALGCFFFSSSRNIAALL